MYQLADTYKKIGELAGQGRLDDLTYYWNIIRSNKDIPRILADTNGFILDIQNIDTTHIKNPQQYLQKQLRIMQKQHKPIEIYYSSNKKNLIYYKNSKLIIQLKIYPFIQLLLVLLFIMIAYFAFNSSRKYEQNKVWTGMSRETAHQLGTPVSSLMALSENIKHFDRHLSPEMMIEFDKDIKRLEMITDRFAKIGTIPKLEQQNVYKIVSRSVQYLSPRISKKVDFSIKETSDKEAQALIIPSLFDWVIENIVKNAINAMEGEGKIEIDIQQNPEFVHIDITDNGKGIARSKHKTIFKAGYTTNKRGWGLGLSLSKRIIEMYHKGLVFVKFSEQGKGSTFRIKLKKR
jgi:signal transduction histidine kinase